MKMSLLTVLTTQQKPAEFAKSVLEAHPTNLKALEEALKRFDKVRIAAVGLC